MELDKIQLQTTWNDAAESINQNFAKLVLAITALQAEGGGIDEAQLEQYLTDNGYTKQDWVLAQKYITLAALEGFATEDWVNQQKFLKSVEGSAFISVSPDNIISLDVDDQGGLGATEQGLGIVSIPDGVLNDSLKTINGESIVGTGNIVIQGGGGGIAYESDPVFKASPAAKITDEDIERWNTDNGADIVMDTEMSDTSENAVQNKVIKEYVDSKIGGGSGEAAESDVICVVWDDDTSDIPSNKEAYQKLAESINTVGKPAAVMVCVETGYRWGIAKYYWKSNVGGDIELTTPVTESGLYCVFTLTSEGVCTASYKQVDLGGGGLKYFVERYVYAGDTEEEKTYNLESLAMLEEGADILWAGMGGLQPNYEYGSMWGYMATLESHYGVFAKVDIDSETGALVMQTVEFIRDFYFAQGSEMKVLAANFFKIEGWLWEPAFHFGRPILFWQDGETDTMVNAYFLLDGLRTAYVSINIETGEVGSPVPVQSN